ncbi:Brp/Blh family beta-carotene 15,15'-dioxygenase [Spiribacter vilamensis]|uniref:Probable beta-carotene 15,15'-dioxygenase n=1 Tax=Spiribacter vilamensis TaxID=531306 RepID=A0A4Q8CZ62_9GAMM|nr:Brp/Blh family beta-carotene 15,15'-dioxygenase [Spiribacter vilamensis]RZU98306.1 Brp/Blh family beta-carotene 15,15'-monooxygenase [Spiribacter vilamensis]TVO60804.1 beta-carotene 15,15'-monooxygenase [Spiribacter vilamensis]
MDQSYRPPAYWLFPVGLLLSLGISLLPGQWPLYVVLAISTAVLGLPHGSLDTEVARRYLHLNSFPRLVGFLVGYMALSGIVIAIWLQIPNIALGAFLLYSAVHFGDDVAHRLGRIGGIGYGLWILGLPVTFHPGTVEPLFAMLGADQTGLIIAAAPWALAVGGAILLGALALNADRAASDWRDPLLLAAGAALLHPLAYFIAYWCFLHSPRHLELAARDLGLQGWRERLRAVAPTTLATYALAIAAVPFLINLPSDAILMQVIFIGLAALTVPHMILEFIASPHRAE